MGELKVINEEPISMIEVKNKLASIEKEKTLSFRAEKTKEYINNFVKITKKESEELSKSIQALDIPRLKERHISKIVDILPKDLDSLKILLSGETITIKDEDLKRILDVIPK